MNLAAYSLKRYRKWVIPTVVLALLVEGAALACGASLHKLNMGIITGFSFLGQLFPPDWANFADLWEPALQSIVIALLGTVLGTAISLLCALCAAANIAPPWLKHSMRFLFGLERSLPEIVILLILVAAFGLGAFAGVLALTIGCVGMLGKLFADAIEELDPATIESLEAVGAGKLQVMVFGVIQQIIPSIISFSLFRFELSIRLSVVLGAVGAGGIGLELYHSFMLLEYQKACSALILTLVMVFLTGRLSAFIRRKFKVEGVLK